MTDRGMFRGLVMSLLLGSAGCRPEAPDPQALPRLAVPFDSFTDGSNPAATPVPTAQPVAAAPPVQDTGDLPDPPAQRYREYVEYELQFARGEVLVKSTRPVHFAQPRLVERRVGRFALELFVGATLLERTRFDFPLLGAGETEQDDPIEHGLTTDARVLIPLIDRAMRAQVLDRKTRKIVAVTWPPFSAPPDPVPAPQAAPATQAPPQPPGAAPDGGEAGTHTTKPAPR